MWIARKCNSFGQTLPGEEDLWLKAGPVVVGRMNQETCHISFQGEKSVSRKHAELLLHSGRLYIVDLGSKFGTTLTPEASVAALADRPADDPLRDDSSSVTLQAHTQTEVHSGDFVRFGASGSAYVRFVKRSMRFCFTRVDRGDRELVRRAVLQLGGEMTEDVDKATHVIMNPPLAHVTPKILATLVDANKHLIGPAWFTFTTALDESRVEVVPPEAAYYPEVRGQDRAAPPQRRTLKCLHVFYFLPIMPRRR
jgi:hypothetical protein